MKALIISCLLLSIALSTITCSSGQVYAKFSKKCGTSWASEESFEIWGGGVKLQTSPTFENNELRVLEYCLTATTNNQYLVKMIDSYGDSWTSGSWLMVEGINGNRVFKNFLADSRQEEYTISLYYGVNKNDQWRLTSGTVSGSWTEYNYGDSSWAQVTLGSVTTEVSGPQYFRKTFTGLASMAAYELSMNYRYGIVAYVNGNEVYRDNMPDGVPTPTTYASGSYTVVDYHAVIRPGAEVANSQSVLAVELHFLSAQSAQTFVDFNAYLSILASDVTDDSCFIYPYDVSISSTGGSSSSYILDYSRSTSFYSAATALPVSVTYSLSGPSAFANGVRVWPYSSPTSAPRDFVWQGANSASATTWTNIITKTGASYTAQTYSIFNGYFNAGLYSFYKLTINAVAATYLYAYEIQPVVCSIGIPQNIVYETTPYTFYARFEQVFVQSRITEFTNCQINPAPAAGLTFDQTTCALSGFVNSALTATYTVTSTMNGQQYTGSFTLQINECAGTLVNVLRSYKYNAVYEGFSIADSANPTNPVLTVATNSGQNNNEDVNNILCLTGTKYIITTTSTLNYWYSNSYVYVNAILGGLTDYETIIRARFDNYLGLETSHSFNVQYAISPVSQWYYKMNEVPSNWYGSDTSGWATGTTGSFTGVTNQIQLYKKEFTVSSLTDVAGIVISLKYQYGVIIYLNNHEVFRKGVTGDLSTSSFSSTSLADANFRQISLPIKTMGDGETSSVDYITTGTNRIAIALVAAGPAQTTAYFDCAVRLMGEAEVSRAYDYSATYSTIYGYPSTILNHYYIQSIYYSTCANNYIQISFNDDRHEWISSISIQLYYTQSTQQVRQFVLKAKNAEDTEWTTLKTVTGMTWSLAGQKNKIWIANNKAWNQYRFENFATGSTTECYWKLGDIDMMSNAIQNEIPALAYAPTSIYKNIEMGEVYPNSNYYYDFTVTPNLPTGINLDPHTGTISGTAHDTTMSTTYTIGAKKVTGESVTAQFQFGVEVCTGGKSLITLVARSDTYPQESSYKVYQGKGMSGQVVAQVDRLRAYSALNYGDFCFNHGIYTIELKDTSTGWNNPAGYYLTVDVGEMKFDMGQVYATPAPASVTTMFSSFLPFQIEYDDWKVNMDGDVPNNWNAVDYDDSTWTVTKAANIGTSEATTVYIRRDINIDNYADYQVLNVRVKYAGGVVAYFNGRKVARFNLEENFDSTSLSLAVHDENTFSKFHIVLPTVGITNGKNVMAFEIHRPVGQSSSQPVVFDATGVFGVNDCSIGVDSYINIDGSTGYVIGDLSNFFDLTPVTYGYQPNVDGTYLSWSVENLEGTKFNSFALQTVYERTSWGFSIYARDNQEEDFTSIFEGLDLSTVTRGRSAWPVPVGIAGYRHYKWEVDDPATSIVYISAYIFQYCKASGTGVCEGEGDYPPVAEGQISPGECDEGFRGYSYRECTSGQLGPVKKEKCFHKLPSKLSYDSDRYTLVMNTQVNIAAPTYLNIIEKFYLSENTFLPDGLTLDTTTGAITGVPTSEMELKQFTIYGENPSGVTSTTINLSVRKGECKADGNFPKTQVGEIAEYQCSLAGSYVGTQKRACLLGTKDGEWQKIQGVCMPISMIILLVIVVIIVVAVVIFFIARTRKTKAVGGVKGKKSSKNSGSKKALEKKGSNKAIKV